MAADLQAFLDVCRAGLAGGYGTIGALFAAGLAGGLIHCAGMCGPFVLGQALARPGGPRGRVRRALGAFLWPYHLGRATTYAGLGAVVASGTGLAARSTDLAPIAVPLLVLAAAFMLVQASGSATAGRIVARLVPPIARRPSVAGRYTLGVLLGFLPCGLLWAGLAGAAATADPVLGAAAMAAFAAGTAPALMLVAYAGHGIARRVGAPLRIVAIALLVANAGTIGLAAWAATP